MAGITKLTGIVVRETVYGDSDKLLEVLTAERGLVTMSAKGARNTKSFNRAASHVMFYGELAAYEKDGRMWLREASCLHDFYDVSMGIDRLALISYFFEVIRYVCFDGDDDEPLLRLLLNALYVLEMGGKTEDTVRAVFELRCAACMGFAPELSICDICGERVGDCVYSITRDECYCPSCRDKDKENRTGAELNASVRAAAEYIVSAPIKRVFAFSLDAELLPVLYDFTESYLTAKTEHGFASLAYYKGIRGV